ncbi:MAG: bifunctional pyr operon transcriptional regulator/uracil phosphoribosyltransferase PyrR [Candidatus Firestonebacteria bacterium]
MIRKIMDKNAIEKTLSRLSHEIIERNENLDEVVLIGIKSRGDIMARRIADKIKNFTKKNIPVGAIDITFYRDDVNLKISKAVQPTDIRFDINNKSIILIDDVLFTGRSTRSAIDALLDFGRPGKIQLLVLIDRGHKELPIQADYVGKNIPTSLKEEVKIKVKELDGEDSVEILEGEIT